MKKTTVKILIAVSLAAALLLCGGVLLLKFRQMYHFTLESISQVKNENGAYIYYLENKIDALAAQVKLAHPDAYKQTNLNYDWAQDGTLIAHGMGSLDIDGELHDYTNSREAFEANYAKGLRVFEVDFLLTSDGALVSAHDWERYGVDSPMTLMEFQQASFQDGKITQLTGADIIDLLIEYQDIYIVTDSKYTDMVSYQLEFNQLVYLAQQKNALEVLDRVIVQIYNQGMYDLIYDIYPWKSVIYTMYMSPDSLEDAISFCQNRGIQIMTRAYGSVTEEETQKLKDAGIMTFAFTVNEVEEIRRCMEAGVVGFYTDYLVPEDLK